MSIQDWQRLPKARDPKLVEDRRSIEASSQVIFNAVKQLCELNAFSFDRFGVATFIWTKKVKRLN